MSSTYDYLEYVLDQLSGVDNISYRYMMGEYVIYFRGRVAGFIINDRLLVKAVPSAEAFIPDAERVAPFPGGHSMLLADIDDRETLTRLFNIMYDELSYPKPRKRTARQHRA